MQMVPLTQKNVKLPSMKNHFVNTGNLKMSLSNTGAFVSTQQKQSQNPFSLKMKSKAATGTGFNARTYAQIMDEHAEHILYVRNGSVLEETPEFESFKRVCEQNGIWEQLNVYIQEI
jgi:hypothetical protein